MQIGPVSEITQQEASRKLPTGPRDLERFELTATMNGIRCDSPLQHRQPGCSPVVGVRVRSRLAGRASRNSSIANWLIESKVRAHPSR